MVHLLCWIFHDLEEMIWIKFKKILSIHVFYIPLKNNMDTIYFAVNLYHDFNKRMCLTVNI